MRRRDALVAFVCGLVPVVARGQAHSVSHPTEAQLLGMSEEECDCADDPAVEDFDCAVCNQTFAVADAEIVIGSSPRLIIACPNCRVVQMLAAPSEE